jgi:hypothetical protein
MMAILDLEVEWMACGDRPSHARPDQFVRASVQGGDVDRALAHLNFRAAIADGDAENRALDDGSEIGCADTEMRAVLMLDPENRCAVFRNDLEKGLLLLRRRDADPTVR